MAEKNKKDQKKQNIDYAKQVIAPAGLMAISGKELIDSYNRGDLTGRTTLYHGTNPKARRSIHLQGFKANKANDADSYTRKALDHMKNSKALNNKVYFSRWAPLAAGVATDRHMRPNGEKEKVYWDTIKKAITVNPVKTVKGIYNLNHDIGKDVNVIKVKLPMYNGQFREVANPELLNSKNYEEYVKKILKKDPSKVNEVGTAAHRAVYETLKHTGVVIGEDIPAEYIVGSKKYKKTTAKEVANFVKTNPLRFAKGVGVPAAFLLTGANMQIAANKKRNSKEASEVMSFMDKIAVLRK